MGLAARRLSFVSLTGNDLYEVCRQDDDGLPRVKVVLGYVGGASADMPSHFKMVTDFLALVWDYDGDMPLLRRKAASGLVFDSLLRGRRDDWLDWVRRIVSHAPRTWACRRYLRDWLRGHFIAIEQLTGTRD